MSGHTLARCRLGSLLRLAAAVFALAILVLPVRHAAAHEYMLGELHIDHPWTRATPNSAKVGGGYLKITNKGGEADRLVAGSADFAGHVELHEMKTDNGIMVMRPVEGGIEIPAGGTVELKPGGLHIMFMGLKEPLVEGEARKVTLTFEKAGDIELEFSVDKMGAKQPGGMNHGNMDHSGHGMSN